MSARLPEPATTPLLQRILRPDERIIWSGRPRIGIAPGDGEAALIAAVVAFSTLGTTSILLGWDQTLGTERAGLAACVLGLAVALGRATIAGSSLTLGLALQAPMFALAAAKVGLAAANALLCPGASLGFLAAWAGARGMRNRSLRYHLSGERGFIERPGLYVISFEFEGAPEVVMSRLAKGALGKIRFLAAAHGRLHTRAGGAFPVPLGVHFEFVRVEEPEAAVRAWETDGASA